MTNVGFKPPKKKFVVTSKYVIICSNDQYEKLEWVR